MATSPAQFTGTSANMQKLHLKALTDFYNDIIVKSNQNFLQELIEQSSQPQIEGN